MQHKKTAVGTKGHLKHAEPEEKVEPSDEPEEKAPVPAKKVSEDEDEFAEPPEEPKKKVVVPAKKRAAAEPSASADDDMIELDSRRRVQVKEFKGKLYVDIREFYIAGAELKPTKKGTPNSPSPHRSVPPR